MLSNVGAMEANLMAHSHLDIQNFRSLSTNHPWYVVPAYRDIPVSETRSMQILRRELGIRRKTVERLRVIQQPGDTFHFKGTKSRLLVCVMLADNPDNLTYAQLYKYLSRAVRETVTNTAIIGDGFRVPSNAKNRDAVMNGFELLCRSLRRLGFSGTVYEPPEYQIFPDPVSEFTDERITDTHMIISPEGNVTQSVPPTMLRLSKQKP
jgi:hypothetical protein